MKNLLCSLVVMLFVVGCATNPLKKVDANEWAHDYYNQPRSSDLISLEGSNASITITGITRLKVSTQLPIISVIPREPSWMDSFSSILPMAGMTWMGINAINRAPTVVNQPAPVIVEPVIVK